ncbi:MAG: MATE family efflux transporter [Amoebophilaceae bacterium]|nr:MATE family efflux transporter [Amoebophilaceae bacterium]
MPTISLPLTNTLREYAKVAKSYATLSGPLIASGMILIITPLSNNLMVGRLGPLTLAAASIANKIYTACSIFPIGISYGLTPLIVTAKTKKKHTELGVLLQHALCLNVLLGCLFVIPIILCARLLPHLQQDYQVILLAQPYLYILAYSLIPTMILTTFTRCLEGLFCMMQLMGINIIGALLNILINYLLVYGHLGVSSMGLNGIGWAALLSRTCMMFLAGIYVFRRSELPTMRVRRSLKSDDLFNRFKVTYFIKLVKLGIPVSLHLTLEMAALACTTILIGCLGTDVQAASTIVDSFIDVVFAITWALSTGTSILVCKYFSTRDTQSLKKVIIVGFIIGGVVTILFAFGLLYAWSSIFTWYHASQEVIHIASRITLAAVCFILADSMYTIGLGALRGMHVTFQPMYIASASNWLIGLLLGYFLTFRLEWGIAGMWWAKTAAFSFSAIAFAILLCRIYNRMTTKQVSTT